MDVLRTLEMTPAARGHRFDAWRALFAEMARRRMPTTQQHVAIGAMVEELLHDDTRPCEVLVKAVLE